MHYISEAVFHTCRILAYLDKTAIASKLFKLGDALFVVARLSSVTMSVLTFWFGLASVPAELQVIGLIHVVNAVFDGWTCTCLKGLYAFIYLCSPQPWQSEHYWF